MICQKIVHCTEESSQLSGSYVDPKGCGSRYLIENGERKLFSKVEFENCVFDDLPDETKCDLGFFTETNFFYVELKGSNVKKGVNQLLSTLLATERCFPYKVKKARLVVSKFPAPRITKNTKAYKDLMRKVGNDLIIKQNVYTENI